MIFNKSYTIKSEKTPSEIRQLLIGKHMDLHDLDFEIIEKDRLLKVIPHAEYEEKLRILPISHLEIKEKPGGSAVNLFVKPRRIDVGGPYLLIIFCIFIIIAGIALYLFKGESVLYPSIGLISAGILIFIIFWIKLQSTYFDYVRKIKSYIVNKVQ